MTTDRVDRLLEQWQAARPDLDPAPLGIVGRIMRLAGLMERRLASVARAHGLTVGEFDVIATMRRQPDPGGVTPSLLLSEMLLTSGAMTNRLDRLEVAGLIVRAPDPGDRRVVRLSLTPRGTAIADQAVAARFDDASEIVEHLAGRDRRSLERSLRRLLTALEESR